MRKLYESILGLGFLTDTIDMTRLRSPGNCTVTVDGVATIVVEYFDGTDFVTFFTTSATASVSLPIADQIRVRVTAGTSTTSRFVIYQADQSLVPVGAKSNLLTGGIEFSVGGKAVLQQTFPRAGAGGVAIDWATASIGTPTAGWTITKDTVNGYLGKTVLNITATAGAADTGTCVITIPSTYLGMFTRLGFPVSPGDAYYAGASNDYYPQLWFNYGGSYHKLMGGSALSHVPSEWRTQWSFKGQPDNVALSQWPLMAAGALTSITIVLQKRPGQAVANPMFIGPVLADPVTEMLPTFSIFCDGGYQGQWDYARPILQQYGFRASFATVVPRVGQGGYLTAAQCDSLYALGHEHICHTGTAGEVGWNDTGKYPDGSEYALVKADLAAFDTWAAARNYDRGRKYGVVGFTNGLDPTQTLTRRQNISKALVDSGYKKFRQLNGAGFPYYGDTGSTSLLTSPTHLVQASAVVGDVTAIIDKIIARGTGWYGFTFHDVVLSGATANAVNAATLDGVAAHLAGKVAAGVCNVRLFSESMDRVALIPAPNF